MKKILGIFFLLFLCVSFPISVMAHVFSDTIQSFVGDGTGFCWFCEIFATLFEAMNDIATDISTEMSDDFLMVMGVALLFSIGFKTAKMLTSLQAVDLMQYLTDMFRHLGRAIIATAFLWTSLSVFTYIVSPVLTLSLSLSTEILNAGGARATITSAMQGEAHIAVDNICHSDDDDAAPLIEQEAQALDAGDAPQKAFAPSVKAALLCVFRTISASLMTGMVLGATLYYGGIDVLSTSLLKIGTAFKMMFAGVFITLGHLFIYVAVPFKYIDSMVRMAFVCALMPLWIILWVFEPTKGYTKKAWDMFLSTCAIFLCMSVVLVLVMRLINGAFDSDTLNRVVMYLSLDQAKAAAEVLAGPEGGGSLKNLLVAVVMCFTGYKMLGTATTLASSFIGTMPNLGVGDQMAKTSVQMANFGKTAAVAAGVVGGRATKAGLNKLGDKIGKPGLGDKTASVAKTVGAHTGAALLTGGVSLLASGAMAANWGRNAYNNRYVNRQSPVMGAKGTNMGVNTAAMGLADTKSFTTTGLDGRPENRTEKTFRDIDGNQLKQTFDKKGNLRNETLMRKDGSTMTKSYDEKGNVQREYQKHTDGSTTQRFYDADGKIRGVHKDAKGNEISRTTQTLDKKGHVASEKIMDKNGETITKFDEKGNIRSKTHKDTEGSVSTQNYNESGQLISGSERDKNGNGHNYTHRYDADSKYYGTDMKFTDGAERAVLKDEKGNITGVTQINKDGSGFDTTYKNGEPVKTTYYDKDGNVQKETIHDVKETHRETVEREVVQDRSGGAPSSAPAPETKAPAVSEAPASPAPVTSTVSTSSGSAPIDPAILASQNKEKSADTSALEAEVRKVSSDAADAKRIAENAQLTAQIAAGLNEDKDKKKNRPENN